MNNQDSHCRCGTEGEQVIASLTAHMLPGILNKGFRGGWEMEKQTMQHVARRTEKSHRAARATRCR
jgi:hypothetical protein